MDTSYSDTTMSLFEECISGNMLDLNLVIDELVC